MVDRSAAFVALVASAPLLLLLCLLVRLTSAGPAIYAQTRIGYKGKLFRLYKFRSMYHNCEKKTGPVWAAGTADSRITPVGKFLRMTYLDELPQLVNVLRGEMSLVGPRPERPEITAKLRREFPHDYYGRLLVKPGITGLAQIHLRADLAVEDVRKKLHYDLLYVRRVSVWLDLKTIARTVLMIVVPATKPATRKTPRIMAVLTPEPASDHVADGALLETVVLSDTDTVVDHPRRAAVGTL